MVEQDERSNRTVVGIGSALMDVLLYEEDSFLDRVGAARGGRLPVTPEFIESVLAQSPATPELMPGGSARNCVVGVGRLGGAARFVGCCGCDQWGDSLVRNLEDNAVEAVVSRSETDTGRVLSIVTPDAQRSMFAYVGAVGELTPADITPACFEGAAVVYLEGYLLFDTGLVLSVVTKAKAAGARIALDLASYTVVDQTRPFVRSIVQNDVDILLANEDEARAFSGESDEFKALSEMAAMSPTVALKLGARGSRLIHDGRLVEVPAAGSSAVIDTTGAGDLWAAGFLHGLAHELPVELCGRLASICGYEVCRVMGATIPDDGWERIRKLLP